MQPQYGSPSERRSLNTRIKVDFSLIQHLGVKCFKLEMVKYNGDLLFHKKINSEKSLEKHISDAVKYGNYRFQEPLREVTIVSHCPHSKISLEISH